MKKISTLIGLSIISILVFWACRRTENLSSTQNDNSQLVSEAKNYFESNIAKSSNTKKVVFQNGGVLGIDKVPMWEIAYVQNLPFCSQTVVVPLLATHQYVSLLGKKESLTGNSYLIVYKDNENKQLLNYAVDFLLKNSCQSRAMFDYLVLGGLKLDFTMDGLSKSPAQYHQQKKVITFQQDEYISYVYLQEELFHAYQNLYYTKMPRDTGRSNIEFEAKVFRDLILLRTSLGCCFTVTTNSTDQANYYNWLVQITKDGAKYPGSWDDYYLDLFRRSWKEYNFPTNPYGYPLAMLNLFQNNNCM